MKKIFGLFVLFCAMQSTAKAQFVSLTDAAIRDYLQLHYPSCFNGSGQLDTTCTTIVNLDTLRLTDAAMSSLDDLRYFDNLVYLEIGFNNLITFQNLPASLQTLVFDNPMSMLGSFTLPPGLKKLVLKQDEFLSYVPAAWPAGLKFLDLSGCGYTSLTNLPASLDTLIIAGQVDVNGLTVPNGNVYPSLTTLAIPANLKYLDCSRNGLATLNDIPNSLTWLDCSQQYSVVDDPMTFAYKQIPKLNQIDHLSNNLVELYCHTNSLSSLPALPASLKVLSAYYNKYNINFSYFNGSSVNFSNAGISTVPDFPNGLTTIRLNLNNISCLPYIPATVTSFYINQNPLNCLPNSLPGGLVNTDATAIPLCNAVNNSYQCERHPIISGNIFYDNNLNGTQDPGELPRAYVRVQLENGTTTYSNANGHYELTAAIGSHTVTIDPPTFYNATPNNFVRNITLPGELIQDLIALQRTQLVDSMRLSIATITEARPGFPIRFQVHYENVGTTSISPSLVFDYDETRLTYNSSTNASVSNNGQALLLSLPLLQPGQNGTFTVSFTVQVSTPLGTILHTTGTLTAGASVTTDSIQTTVIGSFDPNDKQATASLTRLQIDGGGYIDYLIRFQNTGTASAIRVVLADTLNTSRLKPETFQVLDASHVCNITQTVNILYFDFKDINLPASSVDEPGSHGFVRFRVKPLTGLPDNTTASNRASIYFDFNSPVPTGDANTILNLAPVPVQLSSFVVQKQAQSVQINWATAQEINSDYFIVERSSDQLTWMPIRRVVAAGSSSVEKNYRTTDDRPVRGINYYRLKPVDRDGSYHYSETRSVWWSHSTEIVVAPNPAKEKTVVYIPGNAGWVDIQLFDPLGRLISRQQRTGETVSIDLFSLNRGVYYLIIESSEQRVTRKIVVE